MKTRWLCGLLALGTALPGLATEADPGRVPVLAQVAHPHTYYWREMYMPQLTAGPSAASFSPDGASVIYSMQGSLWRQRIGEDTAVELTHGPGYDFQPDWSPDGRRVVFTRQHGNALNLVLLDLDSGTETALTTGDAVNLEPRWSPDGERLAFVSSRDGGYLGIYLASLPGASLDNVKALVAGGVTEQYRYYYSAADHAINPAWSPDGKTLYYVSNAGTAWGSGGLWSVPVDAPGEPRLLLQEETTWAARPQMAHDGKRLLYASYRGRQTHQLWLASATGEYPLPLTFGDYDIWQPRWSPDDRHLLYVSNEHGGLELVYHTVVGGARQVISPRQRVYRRPMQTLDITLRDATGKPLSGRVSVLAADGRHYAPTDARIHADDYVDTAHAQHETHYFHCHQRCTVTVPRGEVAVSASRGFDYRPAQVSVALDQQPARLELTLAANPLPERFGAFRSADLHVHMNYGGKYRQDVQSMAQDASAEHLDIVYNLIVNKEERIPDIAAFRTGPQREGEVTVYQGQEYHSSYWGHLGLLHLQDHFLTPDFSSYWHTALASPYPDNGTIQELAREQGAVTGYVHPFEGVPDPQAADQLTHSLPVDVALGRTDYLEIVSFANHEDTAAVWYRLLNLGFRLSAGAGTDAMTNYASLRGPIGLNRLYLEGVDPADPASLSRAIRKGHGFASNGPLLGLLVDGRKPGDALSLAAEGASVNVEVSLRSPVPVARLELVRNGEVVQSLPLAADGLSADTRLELPVTESGWLLLRAVNKAPHPLVQDIYTYATTNPVWLEVPGKPQRAPEDAAYFLAWLERIAQHAGAREDYNHPWERTAILDDIDRARRVFLDRAE